MKGGRVKGQCRVLIVLASLPLAPIFGRAQQMQQPMTKSPQMSGQPASQATPAMPSRGMPPGSAAGPSGGCDPQCVGMMQKERAVLPWIFAAGAAFAVLSIAALALLVVLEILWIRLWARRLKLIESK